jgi:uncharacterized protein YbaA (DUF1428 family)
MRYVDGYVLPVPKKSMAMPFDVRRTVYGGFRVLVDL